MSKQNGTGGCSNLGPAAERYRIYLAEDNPADVYLIRHALTSAGLAFELTVFEDGAEAMRFVQAEAGDAGRPSPDLIVLDLNLPKRTGTDILAAIREQPHLTNVPVAILTSSASPADRAQTLRLKADRYFLKPLDLDDFLKIGANIRELLRAAGRPKD
ncbi:MAG: response regulator [Bryobacterales bacterium]|nr:response regulator [Bryobacterales bacterium]